MDDFVLKSFIARLAGIYSASTITNYIAAVRAWQIIHGAAWTAGGLEIEAHQSAKNMAPRDSTPQKTRTDYRGIHGKNL